MSRSGPVWIIDHFQLGTMMQNSEFSSIGVYSVCPVLDLNGSGKIGKVKYCHRLNIFENIIYCIISHFLI